MTENFPDPPSRYFSTRFGRDAVKIGPCQIYITTCLDELLETLLGSCVAACVRDPLAGVAGINHFMLPETDLPRPADLGIALRYGNHAMDLLIEGLISRGARMDRLEVKLFGGANVMVGPMIGAANAAWVTSYVEARKFKVLAQDMGGEWPRSVHYFPATGLVLMQRLERGQK